MLYIAVDNRLAVSSFGYGAWKDNTEYFNLANLSTTANARALSLAIVPNNTYFEFLLTFENPDGAIRTLHGFNGYFPEFNMSVEFRGWEDITEAFYSGFYQQDVPNITYAAPFTMNSFSLSTTNKSSCICYAQGSENGLASAYIMVGQYSNGRFESCEFC